MIRFLKVPIMFFFVIILVFGLKNLIYQYVYISKISSEDGLNTIKEYEKVILFHVPLSPYTKQAVDKTLEKCQAFILEDEKLYCYETLRASLIQTKSFYQPYENVIEEITPLIADLRTKLTLKQNKQVSNINYAQIYENQLSLLKYDNTPSAFWSFTTSLSLIIWMFFIIYSIYKNTTIGISGFIIFFIIWIIGLYKA